MLIDTQLTSLANLLALINADNGAELVLDTDVTIEAAQVWEDEEGDNPRNTSVRVVAVPGSEAYKGAKVLRYTRLDLAEVGAELAQFQLTEETTLEEIKAHVVATLGLIDSDVSFVETEVPLFTDDEIDGETATLTLVADEASYAYVGQLTVTVIEPIDPRAHLKDVLAVDDLTGFELPVVEG